MWHEETRVNYSVIADELTTVCQQDTRSIVTIFIAGRPIFLIILVAPFQIAFAIVIIVFRIFFFRFTLETFVFLVGVISAEEFGIFAAGGRASRELSDCGLQC